MDGVNVVSCAKESLHSDHLWPFGATDQFYCPGFPGEVLTDQDSGSLNHDPVNHPKHYTGHPSGVECIQVVRHMNFNLGNVVKYVWRAGLKDEAPTLQDLKKAAWYLNDEIELREKDEE